jgi:hypothetical protein
VKTGIWSVPETWSCKCLPKRTDSIIIPEGIIISVTQPVFLGPSKDGKPAMITIAGVLNMSAGSIHLDPIDRVVILPTGKVTTKSFGGMIYSGLYAQYLDGGTLVRGPITLGDGFSSTAISAITAETAPEGVNISWRSCSEIEVNYYYVARSADGLTFETAAKIDGRGSIKQKVFSFIDQSRPTGIVYYRIDLVDTHGVGATVATVQVKVDGTAHLAVTGASAGGK